MGIGMLEKCHKFQNIITMCSLQQILHFLDDPFDLLARFIQFFFVQM